MDAVRGIGRPVSKPIFEVSDPTTGDSFRIWADGRVAGFPPHYRLVRNGIPAFVTAAVLAVVEERNEGVSAADGKREALA